MKHPIRKKKPEKLLPKQKQWVKNMKAALELVDLHSEGKIKLKTAQQLLNEL